MISEQLREQEEKLAQSDLYMATKGYVQDNHNSIIQVICRMIWTLSVGIFVLAWTVLQMPFKLLPSFSSEKTKVIKPDGTKF